MKEFIKQLSKGTKTLLVAGLVLIVYGFLCRGIPLYFAWESKYLGLLVLLLGLLNLFSERVKYKKHRRQTIVGEKIGQWAMLLLLTASVVLTLSLSVSNAYATAKRFLMAQPLIQVETGSVKGFGLMPVGILNSHEASILILVKGDKAYKEFTVHLTKEPNQPDWDVKRVE